MDPDDIAALFRGEEWRQETDLTLREIGERVGIENQNTLIRTFKKAEGVTPGQYRVANQAIDSQNG